MYDGIKLFLEWVGYFFIAYLIGYSTFLFLSVIVGSLDLYKRNRQEKFKSILPTDYYLPISITTPSHVEPCLIFGHHLLSEIRFPTGNHRFHGLQVLLYRIDRCL